MEVFNTASIFYFFYWVSRAKSQAPFVQPYTEGKAIIYHGRFGRFGRLPVVSVFEELSAHLQFQKRGLPDGQKPPGKRSFFN